jgi:SAM-dependent methyltransferase
MSIKTKIPWQAKILMKIILSRLPFNYAIWQKLLLFRHGTMDKPGYVFGVFTKHYNQFKTRSDITIEQPFVMLELGPGDSLSSGIVAYALGASKSYLIDTGNFAKKNLQIYQGMIEYLGKEGFLLPNTHPKSFISDILDVYSIQYMTEGLLSLQKIPDQSVDFIWSQAVLEHVRRKEFFSIMRELKRIIKPNGICSHTVDLRDHLGGALNNLRFSHCLWESNFMATSGFYTNRIQLSQMLSLFQQAGFEFSLVSMKRWNKLPTPRMKIAKEFQHLSEEELCISGFDVILFPSS